MDESLLQQYPEVERDHFWWVSRREFVRSLIRGAELGREPRVLDVGCGSGVLARELKTFGANVAAIDVAAHAEWDSAVTDGVHFREGDYLEVSSELGSHDCVLALDVMEHIEDESGFVSAIERNVRPGGLIILTVPAYQWMWSRHDDINHHFRRYTRQTLGDALEGRGLRVVRCGYIFFGLIAPKLVAKGLEGFRSSDRVPVPPETINRAATTYFLWELTLARSRRDFLPAGTSVVAVCRRTL